MKYFTPSYDSVSIIHPIQSVNALWQAVLESASRGLILRWTYYGRTWICGRPSTQLEVPLGMAMMSIMVTMQWWEIAWLGFGASSHHDISSWKHFWTIKHGLTSYLILDAFGLSMSISTLGQLPKYVSIGPWGSFSPNMKPFGPSCANFEWSLKTSTIPLLGSYLRNRSPNSLLSPPLRLTTKPSDIFLLKFYILLTLTCESGI